MSVGRVLEATQNTPHIEREREREREKLCRCEGEDETKRENMCHCHGVCLSVKERIVRLVRV
jgi:hypothetical protein